MQTGTWNYSSTNKPEGFVSKRRVMRMGLLFGVGLKRVGFAVAREDGMIVGQPLNLPLIELTNAKVLNHRDLFPFHRWCHHRFELVTVLPLVGQAVDRQQMVPFWVNRLVSRKETHFHQQSHLYWN